MSGERGARILVVDDVAENRRLLDAVLAPHGDGVILAGDGRAALELGRSDSAAIGGVTDLASRLADEATAGQIVIPQRLYAAVEDVVEVEPVGEFTFKGFQRAAGTFNVVAVREPAAEPSLL